jgi:hypothetical protein
VLTHFIGLCKTEWSVTLFIQAAALFECALLIYYIYILCWFIHISIYIYMFFLYTCLQPQFLRTSHPHLPGYGKMKPETPRKNQLFARSLESW